MIVSSVYGFLTKFEQQNVRLLQSLGYEVHYASNSENVIYMDGDDSLEKLGVIYHDIGIYQSPYYIKENRLAIKKLRDIVKREQIEVVHCHTPTGGMVARMACKHLPVYLIYTAHGFHFYSGASFLHNAIFYWIERYLSRYTDAIITINHEDEEAAKTMHAKQVYRVPGVGVDRQVFDLTRQEDREQSRKQLQIDEDTFFLLSVGELRENKNQMRVLESLALLRKQGRDLTKFHYGLVGQGKQFEEMHQFVLEHGLEDLVMFYGYQTDVKPFLQAADVLMFPSVREGLGMAAIEALATGLPVIASNNRGSKEYIRPGENGFLIATNQTKDYAKAIGKVYRDREHWQSQAKRATIRKSTEAFDQLQTMFVMRGVYEDARSECVNLRAQSGPEAVEASHRVHPESDVS